MKVKKVDKPITMIVHEPTDKDVRHPYAELKIGDRVVAVTGINEPGAWSWSMPDKYREHLTKKFRELIANKDPDVKVIGE